MKNDYKFRWVLMSVQVWIMLGSFYCFDIPAALHNSLKARFSNMEDGEFEIYFSGLYSVYSFANTFLPFLTGKMRDKFGDRPALLFTVFLTILGQIIFTYGVHMYSFLIMYLGRIILGWGIESVYPTQNSFVSPFFKNDYLGFTIGMNTLFANFGAILTMYYCPKISTKYGIIWACISGIFFNLASMICAILSVAFDYHAESIIIHESRNHISQNPQQNTLRHIEDDDQPLVQPKYIQSQNIIESDESEFKNNKLYWQVAFVHSLIYTSVLGVNNVSVGLLTERWLGEGEKSEEIAGEMVAVEWLMSGLFTPIFGYLIDKYGGRGIYCLLASLLCIISHITLWYIYPLFSMICLGVGLAMSYAGPWTSFVFIIKPFQLGQAYAFVVALYNCLFSIFPVIVGLLRAYYGTYFYSQIMLSLLGMAAFILTLFFINKSKVLDGKKEL